MNTTLLIMAAGIGSRFGTGIKQLEPVDDANHIIMDYSMIPFSAVVLWTFEEKMEKCWKKILWHSGKLAFIFSISIEMLQLLLRLGTFQLSDIFYNTVGGVVGGLVFYAAMKARKRM